MNTFRWGRRCTQFAIFPVFLVSLLLEAAYAQLITVDAPDGVELAITSMSFNGQWLTLRASTPALDSRAAVWSEPRGFEYLHPTYSWPTAVSNDGLVVGTAQRTNVGGVLWGIDHGLDGYRVVREIPGPDYDESKFLLSTALGSISGDGSVIASAPRIGLFTPTAPILAGSWSGPDYEFEVLNVPDGTEATFVWSLTEDGGVAVGNTCRETCEGTATKWDLKTNTFELIQDNDGQYFAFADHISADGSAVLLRNFDEETTRTFLLVDGAATEIPMSSASAVVDSGNVVFGTADGVASVWTPTGGVQSWHDYVGQRGVRFPGDWTDVSVSRVAADGNVFAGYALHGEERVIWGLRVPEASSVALLGIACSGCFIARRRQPRQPFIVVLVISVTSAAYGETFSGLYRVESIDSATAVVGFLVNAESDARLSGFVRFDNAPTDVVEFSLAEDFVADFEFVVATKPGGRDPIVPFVFTEKTEISPDSSAVVFSTPIGSGELVPSEDGPPGEWIGSGSLRGEPFEEGTVSIGSYRRMLWTA